LGEEGEGGFGLCSAFLDGQTSPVNVMKLMVVSFGWLDQPAAGRRD